ncbi:hypothetical protein DV451_004082 [Geotrichum candidum]|uniref:AHC1-like C2H2 zinc-finger domain-containing protein n=1 Tax=Geotrichum candidum TaxID=1173061 RepID=A0A9P5KRW7_GEOCN|nr:hypothetical protein DV451_004082 [Geotrichum candidum]KAF5107148.1 hypothetical protein DV453_003318 [Geotrichum candidum]
MDSASVMTAPSQRHLSLEDRLRAVVQQEFDLEIALKRQEARTIDEEIAKIENMLYHIKLHYENNANSGVVDNIESTPSPQVCFTEAGVPEFAEFYAQFLIDPNRKPPPPPPPPQPKHMQMRRRHYSFTNNSPHGTGYSSKHLRSQSFNNNAEHPYRLRTRPEPSAAAMAAASTAPKCLIRRADNVLVKLVCPRCSRDNFGSPQGFINHCRISHGLELTTHDAAALECGVEVKESERTGDYQQHEIRLKRRKISKTREDKAATRVPVTMPPPRNVKGKTLPGATKSVSFGKFPRMQSDESQGMAKRHRATFLGRIESSDEENDEDEANDKEEENEKDNLAGSEDESGNLDGNNSSSVTGTDDDDDESESESDEEPSTLQTEANRRKEQQQQQLHQSHPNSAPIPRTAAASSSRSTQRDRFSFTKKSDNLQKYLSLSRFF